MNDLQLALIGLGVLLVAAVWGYNYWQERKYRQHAGKILPAGAEDVLMAGRTAAAPDPEVDAVLREPTFGAEPDVDAAPEPADMPEPVDEGDAPEPQVAALPAEWADGRADCLARIEFVDAVPVAGLWAEKAGWSQQIDKPVQWLGLDEKSNRWRVLRPQDPGAVSQLAAALQLVDRKGMVSATTLAAFLEGIHQLAQRFSGLVELPTPAQVMARAGELDAFCAAVDLQLALHVVPRPGGSDTMSGVRLQPVIAAAGLRQEGERLVAVDEGGAEAFALTCQTATGDHAARIEVLAMTGLSFSLDVPRVEDGAAAFERMLALARQCADALGGQLADAHGNPLAEATLAAIRVRIEELQVKMARMAIPAGSLRALRLFS